MKKMSRAIISTVLISALAFVSLASCKKDVPIDTTPATVKKATDELKLPDPTVTYDQEIYNLPNSVITDGRIVEVKWTVTDDLKTSKLKNNILTVNKDLLKNTVTLTANLSLNNQKKTKDFTINLEPITELYMITPLYKYNIKINNEKNTMKITICGDSFKNAELTFKSIEAVRKIIEIVDPDDTTISVPFKYEIVDNIITFTTLFNRENWSLSQGTFICDQLEKPIMISVNNGQAQLLDYNLVTPTSCIIEISKNKDSITLRDESNSNKEETWTVSVLKGQDGIKLTKETVERTFLFNGIPFTPKVQSKE